MPPDLALQLMPDVVVTEDEQGFVVANRFSAMRLRRADRPVRTLLERIAEGGLDRDSICDVCVIASEQRDVGERARLYFILDAMERRGFLRRTILENECALATVAPMGPVAPLKAISSNERFLLSRFAYMRRTDDGVLVESPLGCARILIHDWRCAGIYHLLATPCSIEELAAKSPGLDKRSILEFVALLAGAKVVFSCSAGMAKDHEAASQQWEFHDLLFHSRSRPGRHTYPYGATFRFGDNLAPSPALKPRMSSRRIALLRPDLSKDATCEESFLHVAEARRSIREPAHSAIRIAQLGEFLFRVARIIEIHPTNREEGHLCEASRRPCASAGGMHELELYLTITRCDGVGAGLYHYDPLAHELEHLSSIGPKQRALVEDARRASGSSNLPDILITIAARFQRMAWKYESIAYSLILKNTGALYQQMYMTATAMNLAPCGLGYGNSDLFADAAGLDYLVETSVGEFMLSAGSSE